MRVLIIGNADEREPGRRFYSVDRKLANGFLRNGHSVWFFSDRDVARASTLLRSSRAGRGAAQEKFREAVRNYAPHAIVLMHSSLIATETLEEAKGRARVAQICVDPLFRTVNVERLTERARVVDATFVTTAGEALKRFSTASNVSAFIPNPVDPSIEDQRNFARDDLVVRCLLRGQCRRRPRERCAARNAATDESGGAGLRLPRLRRRAGALRRRLFRAAGAGAHGAQPQLGPGGDGERAGAGGGTLSLQLRPRQPASRLRARGVVVSKSIDLSEMFEPEREMVFAATPEAMRDAALRLKRDDGARRRIAEAGWRKAHELYNERRVASFIEDVMFRRPLSHAYGWPTALW